MTPTKLHLGQIMIVLAIVVDGIWVATQWVAAALAYQPELGAPWFLLLERPVDRPCALFWGGISKPMPRTSSTRQE